LSTPFSPAGPRREKIGIPAAESQKHMILELEALHGPLINPVLTIGNFDGVHRGHLALFEKVKARATAIGGQSVVMTFDPHPLRVMKPGNGPPLITPTEQKLRLVEEAGIEVIVCIPFNKTFAAISAESFVEDILVGRLGIREIVVGYDYSFGHNRRGNIGMLREMGRDLGFLVHVVEPVRIKDTLVSSTTIRRLVEQGDLPTTQVLLGRSYQISGTVVKGKNRGGRLLGFPTANLRPVDTLIPKRGVYAVTVLVDGRLHDGVTNIGYNPTFGDAPLSIETHILDFSGDLLGKTMKVNFIQRLRDEKTYPDVEALAAQIALDIVEARRLLQETRAAGESP
jgi:riboflavin kinase/FMN adenylyltransferase